MKKNPILALIPVLFLIASCAAGVAVPERVRVDNPGREDVIVRIAVLKDADRAYIRVRGAYRILDAETEKELDRGRDMELKSVIPESGAVVLGTRRYVVKKLRIIPEQYLSLFADKSERQYRGEVDVILTPEHRLLFVNVLDLETYIRGVLYHEVSHRWPLEAIKAQAVATRTYALYQVEKNRKKDFDMTNDIYSQVYGGKKSERYRTNLAAERTRGEILLFRGEVLPAYFHATCGGHTEDAKELWSHDLYPLKGVGCPFCRHSPHYSWKKNLQLKDIQDKLNEKGYDIDLIKTIRAGETTGSGRVKTLEIISRTGKTLTLPGKTFRDIMGPNLIRSNFYRVDMKGYYCDLIGKGWGHGVGLCQWGALGMAQERYGYQAILKFYYPGTEMGYYTRQHGKIDAPVTGSRTGR